MKFRFRYFESELLTGMSNWRPLADPGGPCKILKSLFQSLNFEKCGKLKTFSTFVTHSAVFVVFVARKSSDYQLQTG